MRRYLTITTVVATALLCPATGAQNTAKTSNRVEPLPRDLEIQLALSALPPHLREDATVYVLNPAKGFEIARKGRSEFRTLVARTGDNSFRGSWPLEEYHEDVLYPVSFNEEGSKTHMRVIFDAAEMQAKGTPAPELKKIIQERFRNGTYKAPKRSGVSYMLAPIQRTYKDPEIDDTIETLNYPHVMYFAPGISNEEIGGELDGPGPFVIMPGHHGVMIHPRGEKETAAITKEYAGMLDRLCKIKDVWCLPKRSDP